MAKTSFFISANWQTPDSWGYKNELKYYLQDDLDLLDMASAMLEIRNLPATEPATHELGHSLYALSLIVPTQTEGMKRKIRDCVYQCHMQGELAVHTIEYKGIGPLIADPKQTLNEEFFDALVNAHGRVGQHRNYIYLGNMGGRAAFYIGKKTGKTIDAISRRYDFNPDLLASEATKLSRAWEKTVKPGDTYVAAGKTQRFTPIYNPSNDKDDKEALRRLAPVLRMLQKRILKTYRPSRWNPESTSTRWAKGLKARDVARAMIPA